MISQKTTLLLILILVASTVTATKVTKLRETINRRLALFQASTVLRPHYERFLESYHSAEQKWRRFTEQGKLEDANRHFQAEAMELLIDMYEVENTTEPSAPQKN